MDISIIESVRWVSWERRHPQSFQRWQPAGARCVGKGELFITFGHFQQFWLAEVMFIFFLSVSHSSTHRVSSVSNNSSPIDTGTRWTRIQTEWTKEIDRMKCPNILAGHLLLLRPILSATGQMFHNRLWFWSFTTVVTIIFPDAIFVFISTWSLVKQHLPDHKLSSEQFFKMSRFCNKQIWKTSLFRQFNHKSTEPKISLVIFLSIFYYDFCTCFAGFV